MNEFKVIVVMNEAKLRVLKNKNENCDKNLEIKKYLEDEAFFFKNDKLKAYEILKSVGVRENQLENTYKKLISPSIFYELLIKGKVNINDDKLIIKYDTYKGDLFNKK